MEKYEVWNGLSGVMRDIIIRLCAVMNHREQNVRIIIGMSNQHYLWKRHSFFKKIRAVVNINITYTSNPREKKNIGIDNGVLVNLKKRTNREESNISFVLDKEMNEGNFRILFAFDKGGMNGWPCGIVSKAEIGMHINTTNIFPGLCGINFCGIFVGSRFRFWGELFSTTEEVQITLELHGGRGGSSLRERERKCKCAEKITLKEDESVKEEIVYRRKNRRRRRMSRRESVDEEVHRGKGRRRKRQSKKKSVREEVNEFRSKEARGRRVEKRERMNEEGKNECGKEELNGDSDEETSFPSLPYALNSWIGRRMEEVGLHLEEGNDGKSWVCSEGEMLYGKEEDNDSWLCSEGEEEGKEAEGNDYAWLCSDNEQEEKEKKGTGYRRETSPYFNEDQLGEGRKIRNSQPDLGGVGEGREGKYSVLDIGDKEKGGREDCGVGDGDHKGGIGGGILFFFVNGVQIPHSVINVPHSVLFWFDLFPQSRAEVRFFHRIAASTTKLQLGYRQYKWE